MVFLDNCIKNFETISLNEMDSVSLMKRVDTKFLINRKTLESIFSSLSSHYKILKVKDTFIDYYELLKKIELNIIWVKEIFR